MILIDNLPNNAAKNSQAMNIRKAFYIKLGKGGEWEADSINQRIARIGWSTIPLANITVENWLAIEAQLRAEQKNAGAATRDLKALRKIVTSTKDDIWMTFHKSRLWWCRLEGPVEEDVVSKFRNTVNGWSDHDIDGNQLFTSGISGALTKTQGFKGTACDADRDILYRVLNAQTSQAHKSMESAQVTLIKTVEAAVIELHWKDFETLVDLIFRDAGWRRVSILGETMKFADLELEEPITGERYQVQIKSAADVSDFVQYRDQFDCQSFRKLFFVVHTPSERLVSQRSNDKVELVLPRRLAEMVVDAGLVNWLLAKIR